MKRRLGLVVESLRSEDGILRFMCIDGSYVIEPKLDAGEIRRETFEPIPLEIHGENVDVCAILNRKLVDVEIRVQDLLQRPLMRFSIETTDGLQLHSRNGVIHFPSASDEVSFTLWTTTTSASAKVMPTQIKFLRDDAVPSRHVCQVKLQE
jgi:hypothetical protein